MLTSDKKNLFLAIGLSLVILVGWQYFFAVPQMNKAREQAQLNTNAVQPSPTGAPQAGTATDSPVSQGTAPGTSTPGTGVALTRDEALAKTQRVKIDTPKIDGSVNLTGARIDDVSLKAYHETVDPKSPNIILLSPTGGPNPYYAEFGWVPAAQGTPVPNASTVWTAQGGPLTATQPLTLTWDNGQGLTFKRVIAVDDNAMFTVTDSVANAGGAPVTLYPYGLVSRHGKPVTQGYYILHEGLIGDVGAQGLQEMKYDNLDKEAATPNGHAKTFKAATGGWVGITDKYWAAALVPDQSETYDARFSTQTGPVRTYQTDILGTAETAAPGASVTATTRLFAGAKETAAINGYEQALGIKNFDLMIDWGYFYFITKPMFWLLDHIYKLVGNFGIAILLVTVIVKGIFFPLANKSYTSMAKMKAVQPEMTALRERYPDDKMKQQQELMALYKREKINPVAGCWPVLLQIPVFFSLYKVLFITIEMRHAPFFGWIRDLSAPDPTSVFNLFGLLPFNPPGMFHLGIWPLIMGVTMWLQMKANPEPTDPVQKTMFAWMPVIFTFMLGSFPAGLVIYWSWNNLLSVTQQFFIMKKNGVKVELWGNVANTFRRRSPEKVPAKG